MREREYSCIAQPKNNDPGIQGIDQEARSKNSGHISFAKKDLISRSVGGQMNFFEENKTHAMVSIMQRTVCHSTDSRTGCKNFLRETQRLEFPLQLSSMSDRRPLRFCRDWFHGKMARPGLILHSRKILERP